MKLQIKRQIDTFLAFFIRPRSLFIQEWEGRAHRSSDAVSFEKNQEAQNLGKGHEKKRSERKLCFFSHFDPHDRIDDYVIHYLEALHALGSDIVFISTSEGLSDEEVSKILPFCIKVIARKNIGLDFGSWNLAWVMCADLKLSLQSYQQLILANDSVYGPFFPLEPVFSEMAMKPYDLWAMTSNVELGYHLQSYFLVFNQKLLNSPFLSQFWKGFRYFRNKQRIIDQYEVGLSHQALREGWKLGALIEHHQNEPSDVNATIYLWDQLLEVKKFPFLKTEVLKLNRGRSTRITDWPTILKKVSSYPIHLIHAHLLRVAPQSESVRKI